MPISKFRKHREFIGQVGTILTGRIVAAAVSLLLTPIVARLYSPADFGIAAQFIALAAIASQVASLRYEVAIALPKRDDEALQVAVLAYRLLPIFGVLLLCVIGAIKFGGGSLGSLDLLGDWIWLLPPTVLLMAAQDIQESWLSRQLRFGVVSKSVVLDVSAGQVTRITLGLVGGSTVFGLIMGQLCGVISRLVMQGRAAPESIRAVLRRADWGVLRRLAVQYADFAKLNAPAGLLYSVTQNLPILLFGMMFTPAVAGFFAMANRLSKMPVQIVVTSVRRVFLQKAVRIHNDGGSLRRSFSLTSLGLLAMGTLPALALWMYGQPLLTWLLGPKWFDAGRYLEIIAPWVLSAWASAPCNAVFIVLRRQRLWLELLIATTAVRVGSFVVGHALGYGAEETLGLFVLSSVGVHVLIMIISLQLAGRRPALTITAKD
jgi:O-antigen/teichoic acid export membrane protein